MAPDYVWEGHIGFSEVLFFFVSSCIYFERDRDSANDGRGERERGERKSPAGSELPARSPTQGSNPLSREIRT